jgi:hypothetical protein
MSIDPNGGSVDNPQSLNRYSYTLNNPPNLADSLGLWSSSPYYDRQGVASNPYTQKICSLDGAEMACDMVFGLMAKGDALPCPQNNCTGRQLRGDVWYEWSQITLTYNYSVNVCSQDGSACSTRVYQDDYITFGYTPSRDATTGEYLNAEMQARVGGGGRDLEKIINAYEHLEHPFVNVAVSAHFLGGGILLTVVPWLAFPEECAGTGFLGCGAAATANSTVSAGGLVLIYGSYKFTVEETIPSFKHLFNSHD